MTWQNRPYSGGNWRRQEGYGGDFVYRLARLLNWSFPIGRLFQISLHVHITFVLWLGLELLQTVLQAPDALFWTIRWTSLLFLCVLLHEFGHALACRRVGGSADQILLWPLGGLAMCAAPRRPWPEFVTVVWGPLVNLLLAAGCFFTLAIWLQSDNPISLNPFTPWAAGDVGGLGGFLRDLFVVNYSLLLFNLCLVCFPFDAGRLLQIALWVPLGYRRSMLLSCTWGMFGAAVGGLAALYFGSWLLFGIALFGLITCYQQRQQMLLESPYESGLEFDSGYREPDRPTAPPGWLTRFRQARARRKAARDAEKLQRLQTEVDRILAKVHEQGLASLSAREKRTLQEATDLERDMEQLRR